MRRHILLLALGLSPALGWSPALAMSVAPAQAGSTTDTPSALPPADRAAIQGVIQNQIGAFGRHDDAAAFAYASPGIQSQFGDAATFGAMVRRGYQPVYLARRVHFGALLAVHGRTVQKVELIGPDGVPSLAFYFMERERDGTWRIDGCIIAPARAEGT
ncbi:MAG: DUF4864 domain-containing protein [Alphaproteobacteria bacterium]|nr:DUF4864 domain-containing protein [Alphaproteobacteria bacterium]